MGAREVARATARIKGPVRRLCDESQLWLRWFGISTSDADRLSCLPRSSVSALALVSFGSLGAAGCRWGLNVAIVLASFKPKYALFSLCARHLVGSYSLMPR